LAADEDRPRRLARVLDQLTRRADDVSDCAVKRAMVATVELGLVATRSWRLSALWFARGLHEPRPG
jgi:hypothetical protein